MLRTEGAVNIISTWIDEAREGESSSYADLSDRCIREASEATVTILYAESGEILKGALIEAGAALAAGKLVFLVGDGPSISRVFRRHVNWRSFDTIPQALEAISQLESNG